MIFTRPNPLMFLVVPIALTAFFLLSPEIIQADSETPLTLSKQAVQLEVPFEKQDNPRECGLAVLKMINGFYGQKLNQTQVGWIKNNSQAGEGVMASELVVVLKAANYDTALFQGTLDKNPTGLYYHLEKHRPVIVMITSKDGKSSHYDIINGYDPQKSLLLIMDPAIGPVTVAAQDFNKGWKRAHCFTLVAVPKKLIEKTPVSAH